VFQCSNLKDNNFICGQASKCKNCAIRNGLDNILNNKVSVEDMLISHTSIIGENKKTKWFNVNGSPIIYKDNLYAILSFTDVTQHKHHEDFLLEQLELDLITGAINKYSLLDYINELMKPKKERCRFTICMTDFDDFKKINDQYGHLMGDRVLKIFSKISRKNIRNSDIFGRYGGEEFVFIFMNTKQEQALKRIQKIQKELKLYFEEILVSPITFSAGMIYVNKDFSHLSNYTDIISSVDKMLYKAKSNGKNRIVTNTGEYNFQ